jgi:hypothetical protein
LRREREAQHEAERAKQEATRRQSIEARDWLHLLERTYKESRDRLSQLRQGAQEGFAGEEEACWEILSTGLPQIRKAEVRYWHLAGLPHMEDNNL